MMKLLVQLDSGQIEKQFEMTKAGREMAIAYMRGLVKQRQVILAHKFVRIK